MSATDSVDEKATSPAGKKRGFFSRKSKVEKDTDSETTDVEVEPVEPVEPPTPPVSFTELFRFSTRFELILNAIGLTAAVASGSAQVSTINYTPYTYHS